jgi:CHAD domain-containing protein
MGLEDPLMTSQKRLKWLCPFIHEQFRAAKSLGPSSLPPTEKQHQLRLILKRLRAVDRLFDSQREPPLQKTLRSLSRRLGPIRDQDIVKEWASDHLPLSEQQKMTRNDSFPAEDKWQAVLNDLLALEKKFARLPLSAKKADQALQKSLERFSKAFSKATKKSSAAAFHRLRRRSKELLYQMEALHLLKKAKDRNFYNGLKWGEKLLGKSHDLVLVEEQLNQLKLPEIAELEKSRKQLNQRALKLIKAGANIRKLAPSFAP